MFLDKMFHNRNRPASTPEPHLALFDQFGRIAPRVVGLLIAALQVGCANGGSGPIRIGVAGPFTDPIGRPMSNTRAALAAALVRFVCALLWLGIAAGTSQVQRNIVAERVLVDATEGTAGGRRRRRRPLMDFELTDDQVALHDGIRSFLQGRAPLESLHPIEQAGGGVDRGLWSELAGIGVFSLRADGFGASEAVLAFAELGRALTPGPLVATHLAASLPGSLGAGAADGSRVVGIVEASEPVTVIEHLASLDDSLVLSADGIAASTRRRSSPRSPNAHSTRSHPWRSSPPHFPLVTTSQMQSRRAVASRWDDAHRRAAARPVRGTVELASTYAMERRQFDRPIG